jgi:hypothetical protein
MKTVCEGYFTDGETKCDRLANFGKYCGLHYKKYDFNYRPEFGSEEYNNLMMVKFPELIKEWDFEKNKINIYGVSYAVAIKVWWKCLYKGHSYRSLVCIRTRPNPSSCKECDLDKRRIHDKGEIEKKRETKSEIDSTKVGDDAEEYIKNLLLARKFYKNVERMGNIGGSADICITHFDNSFNYIQVKTLTIKKGNDIFGYRNRAKYADDMLIIMLNNDRNRFALDFSRNLLDGGVSLTFAGKKSKYKDICYTNVEDFVSKMIELIPFSSKENKMNEAVTKEFEMFGRFEVFCKLNNIKMVRNTTNGNCVDCFINGYKAQLKYSSVNINEGKFLQYEIGSTKSCGNIDGKKVRKNYEENDFTFFIIEVGGTELEPDKYKGNFCIIPKEILMKQKILRSNVCKGKKSFRVCAPDTKSFHWARELWNNTSCIPKLLTLKLT